MVNLRSVDLNLLVVLDALLDEAHVSRAARRLHLSQPAVSGALQRCRDLFGDPLLERGREAMRLTPRAEALRGPLRAVLADASALIGPAETPLADLVRTVRVTIADDPLAIVAAPVAGALSRDAPGITVVFQPWRGAGAALRELVDGEADLAVSALRPESGQVSTVRLVEEDYVVAARRDHPAAGAFDLDAWLAYPHVLVSGRGELDSPLDAALGRIGRARRVGLVVPSFRTIPDVLLGSDLTALVPRRSPALRAAPGLLTFEPPLPVPGFALHLGWHARRAEDAAVRHVADLIVGVFADAVP